MAITSQIGAASGIGEMLIANWQRAQLLKPSAIKPVFATIEQGLVLKQLGALSPPDLLLPRDAILSVVG